MRLSSSLLLSLSLVFLCGALALHAQAPSFVPLSFPTGTSPQQAGTADFDLDGNADIVAVNSSDGTITVLLGKGDGTFRAPLTTALSAIYPRALAIGDFNGDGRPDVVLNDSESLDILLLIGKGDGTFQPPLAGNSVAYAFALGDFNGDGKLDIAAAQGKSVSILTGNGDGTFQSPSVIPVSGNAVFIRASDLNRDGKLDLIFSEGYPEETFGVMLGNGDGTFQALALYSSPVSEIPTPLAVGDVNGDGIPDVIVGGDNGLGVSLGKGDGSFGTAAIYQPGGNFNGMTIGDINGDGKPDLILASTANGLAPFATLMLGNGDGTFAAPVDVPSGGGSIVIADFNHDGRPDLLLASPDTNGVSVLINSGQTACLYSVAFPATSQYAAFGGILTAYVTAPSNCHWTTSSSQSWVIPSPSDYYGSAVVVMGATYDADNSPRSAVITIAGQTFSVTQASAPCTYTVTGPLLTPASPSITAGAGGLTTSLGVTTSDPSCAWTASSFAPWISVSASTGTGDGTIAVVVLPDTTGAEQQGTFQIADQTFQVTQLTSGLNFADVPPSAYYFNAVNELFGKGITTGCSTDPALFCPTQSVTRAQMAIFLVRTVLGTGPFTYSPTPYFTDVPSGAYAFNYIQKLYELGITTGCASQLYCPDTVVTRDEMAVFIIRSRYGTETPFTYPSAPYFTDVPPTAFAFNSIQRMKEDNITSGCSATTYCPSGPVVRGDMAIFLMRGGFNQLLPLAMPVIASISPNTLAHGTTGTFSITGVNTNFQYDSNLIFGPNSGVTVNSVSMTDMSTLQVSLTASSTAPLAPVSIYEQDSVEEAVLPNGLLIQ